MYCVPDIPLKLIFWCNLEFAFNLSSFYIHQLPHTIEIDLMEKSINALLNSNLRVIIPDFGAFIIRQNEPRIIVFNEFLRYNDGLLIEYIARTEGFETDIARNMVADYAVEVTKVLDSGKPYTIKGLGTLQKDSAGKIVFDFERTSKQTDTDEKSETEHPAPSVDEVKPPSKAKSRRTAKSTSQPEKEIKVFAVHQREIDEWKDSMCAAEGIRFPKVRIPVCKTNQGIVVHIFPPGPPVCRLDKAKLISRIMPPEWGHFNVVVECPAIIEPPFEDHIGGTVFIVKSALRNRLTGQQGQERYQNQPDQKNLERPVFLSFQNKEVG